MVEAPSMHPNKDIQAELNALQIDLPAPLLPVDLPQPNYFEEFFVALQEQIASDDFLQTLPKNTPLASPEAYFDEFPAKLHTRRFIDDLPKQTPYSLESDYFKNLPVQLMQAAVSSVPAASPLRLRLRRLAPLSMAASIALLLGIGFLFLTSSHSPSVEQQVATLTAAEIEAYIQQHQLEFDTDLTAETLDDRQVDLQKLESDIFETQLNQFSEEEIASYL